MTQLSPAAPSIQLKPELLSTPELLADELKSLAILYAEQGQPKEALSRFLALMEPHG